ncbi:Rhomboid protein 1 [Apiospora kogelbergensis]|uniref:Rhomboid protein 1 n=1 Tax=Apiospora kogelbergensis TaxID=1337665 RepID=UPI00312F3C56
MNVLTSFAPPISSSFHVGLRAAVSSRPANLARTGTTAIQRFASASRSLSSSPTCHHSPSVTGACSHGRQSERHSCSAPPSITIRYPTHIPMPTVFPFAKRNSTPREVREIFGPHIPAPEANRLLRIIHGRRVAGTLDDPDLQQNTAEYSASDKIAALEYLRKHIPVDEIVNAGLRAEDELRLIEEQRQNETEQSAQEPDRATAKIQDPIQPPIGKLPRKPESDSPYGESTIDRIRARNLAARAAEEQRLEAERLKREEEEQLNNIGGLSTEQAQPQYVSPWRQEHAMRAMSDLEEPEEKKPWERLLPACAMTALVLFAAYLFATMYKPPSRSGRIWPEIPPAAATCLGLMLVNAAVYALWKWPPVWSLFNRYMLVIAATPRPLQLVGAVFSHQSLSHMVPNMLALWFFGVRLHDEIGRGNFLALYMASGTLSYLTSLSALVLSGTLNASTLGASGSIFGIMAAYFWMHKNDEFKVFGYPPSPMAGPQGIIFLGLIMGLQLAALFSKRRAVYDIPAHLGGMTVGVLGMDVIRKQLDDRARVRAEKLKTMGMLDKTLKQKTGSKAVANDSPSPSPLPPISPTS